MKVSNSKSSHKKSTSFFDGTLIQGIVEDSIENISETETTSEEKTKMKIKIEQY